MSKFRIKHRDAPGTGWKPYTPVAPANRRIIYETFQALTEHAPDPKNWRIAKVKEVKR